MLSGSSRLRYADTTYDIPVEEEDDDFEQVESAVAKLTTKSAAVRLSLFPVRCYCH